MTQAGPVMPLLAGAMSQGMRQLLEAGKPGKSLTSFCVCLSLISYLKTFVNTFYVKSASLGKKICLNCSN